MLGAIVLYATDNTQYLTKNNKCVGRAPAEINPTPKNRLMVTTCDHHRLREKSTYIFPNKKTLTANISNLSLVHCIPLSE